MKTARKSSVFTAEVSCKQCLSSVIGGLKWKIMNNKMLRYNVNGLVMQTTPKFLWLLSARQATVSFTAFQQLFLTIGFILNGILWKNIDSLFPNEELYETYRSDFLLGIHANMTIFLIKIIFGCFTVFGAIKRQRVLLIPWLILTPVSLVYLIFKSVSLLIVVSNQTTAILLLLIFFLVFGFLTYSLWAVVLLYQQLNSTLKFQHQTHQ